MSTLAAQVRPSPVVGEMPSGDDVPPLEQGDRLSRDEFERRYRAMPGVKAELVEGAVQMASPVRHKLHAKPHSYVNRWLCGYHEMTSGTDIGDNGSTRLDLDNEPQPDLYLLIDPALGGQAKYTVDDFIDGAPELTVEVAASSVSIDMNAKLNVYRRTGVREYLVWRTRDRAIDWFERDGSDFVAKTPAADGTLRSTVFPGLWLDPAALLAGELAKVIATLQQGLASPEHAAFVAQLAAKKPTA